MSLVVNEGSQGHMVPARIFYYDIIRDRGSTKQHLVCPRERRKVGRHLQPSEEFLIQGTRSNLHKLQSNSPKCFGRRWDRVLLELELELDAGALLLPLPLYEPALRSGLVGISDASDEDEELLLEDADGMLIKFSYEGEGYEADFTNPSLLAGRVLAHLETPLLFRTITQFGKFRTATFPSCHQLAFESNNCRLVQHTCTTDPQNGIDICIISPYYAVLTIAGVRLWPRYT
ncbi:hypothetical protein K435DRAFT_809085 [Dendrothele bispora CBS 962.96]|uniref:Uncharacterized protein n=1 Tax=Dendrothele bispora (strain CBS 962.96) TaxID=1314807 RepID=A0A4S8KZK2_DENBC|nr:hypothetical protein K435DRAFT_809085 [Dendrothele bispora CBS 962.96]